MASKVVEPDQRMAEMKTRKSIRKFTSKREAMKRQYARLRRDFLIDHPWCEWGLRQKPPIRIRSEEIHHTRGRIGKLLNDQRFWLAVSTAGHNFIHNNMDAARGLGLLCQKGQWNNIPKQ